MSKPVRLADYLYAQVEELAVAEKRSLANMVQVLLEQALRNVTGLAERETRSVTETAEPTSQLSAATSSRSVSPDVKTDFK